MVKELTALLLSPFHSFSTLLANGGCGERIGGEEDAAADDDVDDG